MARSGRHGATGREVSFDTIATQYPVLQGRIAIDTAVRVLEKKDYVKSAKAIPDMIAKSNIDKINMGLVLAPADFKAVYSVKAP